MVLTGPLAATGPRGRIAPALRALAGADAAILLGPGSASSDLSFSPCRGGSEIRASVAIDDLAVAAAVAARLGGRVLAEPALLVATLSASTLLHLVPPPRWWHGTWLVCHGDATVRVPARLLFHGGLVLG